MKTDNLKDTIKIIFQDRYYSSILVIFFALFLLTLTDSLFNISASNSLVWNRYNSLSQESYYRSSWYYFYLWPILNLSIFLVDTNLSVKFLKSNHRNASLMVVFVGIISLLLSLTYFNNLLEIAG